MEKLYTVSKNKTWSCLWLRSSASYCKIHTQKKKKSRKTTRTFRYKIPYNYAVELIYRIKGIGLVYRMPEELWTEARDIVQETGIMTIPKKKKCKKAKWLSEEALQITVKRREAKAKGENESYTHMNAEFQRIAKRDKRAFLSD